MAGRTIKDLICRFRALQGRPVTRIAGWDISIVDTVADNASSGLYVLGTSPAPLKDVDLRLCGMVLEHDGEPVSVGAGAACLGNPLNAVTWLACTLARMGSPLRAGDVVLSGALGPMVTVSPGAVYEARIAGLGSVRVGFSKKKEGGTESEVAICCRRLAPTRFVPFSYF